MYLFVYNNIIPFKLVHILNHVLKPTRFLILETTLELGFENSF